MIARNLRHQGRLIAALAAGLALFETLLARAAAELEVGTGLRALFAILPSSVRDVFASRVDMISFGGAVAFGFEHPFVLVASIGFVIVATTTPAGEAEGRVLDLILARPVPRWRYVASAAVSVLIAAVFFPLAVLGGAAAGLHWVSVPGELPLGSYAAPALGLGALLLACGGIGLLLAAGARRRGRAASQAAALLLALYVIELLAGLWPALKWIAWAGPFHYFKPVAAAVTPPAPLRDPIVLVLAGAIAAAIGFIRFQRRDI